MNENIIIEIGGFDGEDTEKYAKYDNTFVYCFEPDSENANNLKIRFSNFTNVSVIQKAVGTFNGIGEFYISNKKMSSSINKPSQYSIDNKIIEVVDVKKVEVIRLDTFINENNIFKIDYLHCDAQGTDLEILKSLGDKISIIKKGQVEGSRNKNLYDSENRYYFIIDYLEKMNFIILNKDEIEKRVNWQDLNILFLNKKFQSIL